MKTSWVKLALVSLALVGLTAGDVAFAQGHRYRDDAPDRASSYQSDDRGGRNSGDYRTEDRGDRGGSDYRESNSRERNAEGGRDRHSQNIHSLPKARRR